MKIPKGWERIKAGEKTIGGQSKFKSVIDGVWVVWNAPDTTVTRDDWFIRKKETKPKPSSQIIAANIVKLRLKAKLTQPDVAALAGVSRSVMWYVERGRNPRTDTLDKIATALKCQTKDFFK